MKLLFNSLLALLLCLPSIACSQQKGSKGLVAYYPFSGNAKDESGNGHDGKVTGANLTADRFGSPDCAYSFDDSKGDNILVNHNKDLNITGDITLSAWFNSAGPPNFRTAHTILTKRPSNSSGRAGNFPYLLAINYQTNIVPADHKKLVFSSAVNDKYQWIQSTSDITNNVWNHVVAVARNSRLRLFLNGVPIVDAAIDNQLRLGNSDPLLIGSGARSDKPAEYFKGQLDDIRIYNRALSDEEIQELYHEKGWSGEISTEKGDYLETYTFYKTDRDSFLTLTLSELNKTASTAFKAHEVGSLSFYVPTDEMCRLYPSSTRCDLNILPISGIPHGASTYERVYILRTERTQLQPTIDVYNPTQNTLQYSAQSASELGKVCRLLMPPNLPSDFRGFFGEGNEFHNDVRIANCILWDLGGTWAAQQASQSGPSVQRQL